MTRHIIIFLAAVFFINPLMAQDGLFNKNYELAHKLYEKDIIELVLNKDNISQKEADAFLLAIYYKCSFQDISKDEMMKTIKIFSPDSKISSENQVKIESQFYKIINQVDQLMHTKDYSYLSELVNLPF